MKFKVKVINHGDCNYYITGTPSENNYYNISVFEYLRGKYNYVK